MARCLCARRQTQLQASNLRSVEIHLSELLGASNLEPDADLGNLDDDLYGTITSLVNDENKTVELFKKVASGVVYVTTTQSGPQMQAGSEDQPGGPASQQKATGSGFVWDDNGHIVTNAHVVHGADKVMVSTGDQQQYAAKLVATDPDTDIAVLRVEDPAAIAKCHPCAMGSSSNLQVGQTVLAIGNPFGLDHTLTTGVLSGTERTIQGSSGKPISGVIQTDAAINPGNSGGPLLNSSGEVIGINSQIMSSSRSSAGIGFAVPINTVKVIVDELIAHGKITRAALGVTLGSKETLELVAQDSGIPGALILSVTGPAKAAGMKATERMEDGNLSLGDVVQEIDGTAVNESQDLFKLMAKLKPGQQVRVKVLHLSDRKTETFNVRLAKVDSNQEEKALEEEERQQQEQQQEGVQGFFGSLMSFFR